MIPSSERCHLTSSLIHTCQKAPHNRSTEVPLPPISLEVYKLVPLNPLTEESLPPFLDYYTLTCVSHVKVFESLLLLPDQH